MAGSHVDCLDQHMRRRESIADSAGIHIVSHFKPLTITLLWASARGHAEHVVAGSGEPMWTRRVISEGRCRRDVAGTANHGVPQDPWFATCPDPLCGCKQRVPWNFRLLYALGQFREYSSAINIAPAELSRTSRNLSLPSPACCLKSPLKASLPGSICRRKTRGSWPFPS